MSDVDQLQANISGAVLQPGNNGFAQALEIDNGGVDLVPSCAVRPRSAEDVARAIGSPPTARYR